MASETAHRQAQTAAAAVRKEKTLLAARQGTARRSFDLQALWATCSIRWASDQLHKLKVRSVCCWWCERQTTWTSKLDYHSALIDVHQHSQWRPGQQCNNYNICQCHLSVLWVQQLPRRRLVRKPFPHEKRTQLRTFNELKVPQLARIITIPVHRLPSQPSSHCCSPSFMGESDKTRQQWPPKLTAKSKSNQGTLPRVVDTNLTDLHCQKTRIRILPAVQLETQAPALSPDRDHIQ